MAHPVKGGVFENAALAKKSRFGQPVKRAIAHHEMAQALERQYRAAQEPHVAAWQASIAGLHAASMHKEQLSASISHALEQAPRPPDL
jgi:hypothetical protein